MTSTKMKVGLIGTGPWGLTLAKAFQRQGAEIVAHSHARPHRVEGLGVRMPWQEMPDCAGIDAVIAAGPPGVNLSAAVRCDIKKMPILATKPLMLEAPLFVMAPVYVDYVHLWSPCYLALKAELGARKAHLGRRITSLACNFSGPGPKREFSSLRDYGPHALAFCLDLLGNELPYERKFLKVKSVHRTPGVLPGCENYSVGGYVDGVPVGLTVGSGSRDPNRFLIVQLDDGAELIYRETKPSASFSIRKGDEILNIVKVAHVHDPLGAMVTDFIDNVRVGRANTYPMNLTVQITKAIMDIESVSARIASQ